MLLIGIISYCIAIPLCSYYVNALHYSRLAVIMFIISGLLSIDMINIGVDEISLYCGLVFQSNRTLLMELVLFTVGGLCLLTFQQPINKNDGVSSSSYFALMFCVIGASIILSSYNLVSIYLATELQSFALYILAALSRDSLRSVQASLKYFLLGAWSSAFILLGAGMIYESTGSTSLANISYFISSTTPLILIYCGFLFKVSAAPFHNWAPDVYQNTPTVVTIMLITIPKISIMTALYTLTQPLSIVLLVTAVISMFIGTVTGLVQTKLRRLLTFSTISHVGFIVLCLSLGTVSSCNALVYYIVQYSLTTILVWICIIAYEAVEGHVDYLSDIMHSYSKNALLTISLVISLFSMSGIPPLVGFLAKMNVLWSTIEEGAKGIFIIAILSSVISASYYLKIIKILMFAKEKIVDDLIISTISSIHGWTLAACTAFITLNMLDYELLINSIELAQYTILYDYNSHRTN